MWYKQGKRGYSVNGLSCAFILRNSGSRTRTYVSNSHFPLPSPCETAINCRVMSASRRNEFRAHRYVGIESPFLCHILSQGMKIQTYREKRAKNNHPSKDNRRRLNKYINTRNTRDECFFR